MNMKLGKEVKKLEQQIMFYLAKKYFDELK